MQASLLLLFSKESTTANMNASNNLAAWQLTAKGDLDVRVAPFYTVTEDEILIKNEAISVQPFDARIRRDAYVMIPYPFILGSTVAGTVVAVGPGAGPFKIGDRVVSDTSVYKKRMTKYGAWQQYVVGNASRTVNIAEMPFEEAVTLPFPLQTAVAALHVHLGMEVPGGRAADPEQKVLIWGAGGAVGGYAVQYAKSVGYTVIATASPRATSHLVSIGASTVLDYKSPSIIDDLRALGPYAYLFTASGDAVSQKAIAELLQPNGGKFASVLPGMDVGLPSNVKRIYDTFSSTTQKEGPAFEEFSKWWYGEYLAKAIRDRAVEPAAFEKRPGGLQAIQKAADDVLGGRARAKLVLNPQE